MFLNITDKNEAENKGSSAKLVHYLDKENRLFPEQNSEQWFGHNGTTYQSYEVKNRLDKNIAKLCHDDAKFFLINISPSQKEIAHLKQLYGEEGAKAELKKFAEKIMDEYALNFKRKGIDSNAGLLWFAKLENHRYYSFKDKEVKEGIAKRGEPKYGEQMHIQVIISRKDISNKIKLSPMNNSRGSNVEHSKKVGQFNRVAFKASGERVFDELFDFNRLVSETFKYANTKANGSLAERLAMVASAVPSNRIGISQQKGFERSNEREKETSYHEKGQGSLSLLEIALTKPEYDPLLLPGKKKKRKKRKGQDQSLNF